MAVIDRDLVRAINSGRCFALVGAGLSSELGVPSWEGLCGKVIDRLGALDKTDIARQCRDYLSRKDYPKIFSLAEKALGKAALMAFVKNALADNGRSGRLYGYVVSWPFACYLTTNFDDLLTSHLQAVGLPFVTIRNSLDDMRAIHGTAKNLVVKIHSDTTVPQDIVLTAEQYLDFQKGSKRYYWRNTLLSVLKMVDLVIIGYSATDPDFQEQLERAKEIASPDHPVFMFASGLEPNAVKQGDPTFSHYMEQCLGSDYIEDLHTRVRTSILALGIEVIDFKHMEGFSDERYHERDQIAKNIETLRRSYGTFRGESQTVAEAEIVIICEIQKAVFLSQSGVLNKLQRTKPRMTWQPEAMYRFLSLFSSTPPTSNLLYDCMTQDFYYAGFDIVDSQAVVQYASPMIHQARMQLKQEKAAYQNALGKKRFAELEEKFEHTPDEQKPFYSMQFAFHVASAEAQKRAAAEALTAQAQQTKQLSEKERIDLERFRAKQSEKRRKAVKARRRAKSKKKR